MKIDMKKGKFVGPCAVNPMASFTSPFDGTPNPYPELRVPKASRSKNIAVIGGGPGGMQSVKTLLERGHKVTLYEKNNEIGGQVIKGAAPSFKDDMREYLNYLREYAKHCGASILTGTEATPETIKRENYDALIVAIGAKNLVPRIPGIERAVWAPEVVPEEVPEGKSVVIVGAGAVGLEAAVDLAKTGKKVTVIEMLPTHGLTDVGGLGGGGEILKWCDQYGVSVKYNAKLTNVFEGDAVYEQEGNKYTIAADYVLLAAGMLPLTEEAKAFRAAAPNTEVFFVGDCKEVGDIRDATRSAFDICREL